MVSVSANVVVVVVVELVTAMVVAPMHVHATFVVSTAAQIPAEAISVMAFVATMAFVGVTTNTILEKEKEKEEKEREYRKKRMKEKEEERRKRIKEEFQERNTNLEEIASAASDAIVAEVQPMRVMMLYVLCVVTLTVAVCEIEEAVKVIGVSVFSFAARPPVQVTVMSMPAGTASVYERGITI